MRRLFLILTVIGLPLLGGSIYNLPAFTEASVTIPEQKSYPEQILPSADFSEYPDSSSLVPDKWVVQNEGFDALLRRWVRSGNFNGTVLIARQGEIIHSGAYGYANLRNKEPMTLDTEFQLASVSKMFTATAVMMLYEETRLNFDDPIVQHIPTWPYPEMTIRHLLSHQSGLQRYDGLTRPVWDARQLMSYADVLDLYVQRKPRLFFQPGSDFDYNNSNYVILAALVEYLVRMPFEVYLEQRLFTPLGMEQTYFANHQESNLRPLAATGYKKVGRWYRDAEGDYLDGVYGDKGLHSTVKDLYKFDRALAEGRVLSPETLAMAYQPLAQSGEGRSYGFGVRMKEDWLGLVYHFGWWRGFRTCFIRDLQADQTVIVLSNRDNPDAPVNFWEAFYLLNDWP